MTMQIRDIVVFSHDGRQRALPLKTGQVNIITGASKSGKSALVDIVDYCFAAKECRVPEGPILRSVSWFGLRLQTSSGEAFIARRCPGARASSSEECFVELGEFVDIPNAGELRQTTNIRGLRSLLAGWTGIDDNIHEPPAGQSRPALSATVRHALALCFQPQDEIIRRDQLFHGVADNFAAQALKDTLPYFLGAVDNEYVRKRGELKRLRDQLRGCDRQLAELSALQGGGVSKAATILAEARDAGLASDVPDEWEEIIAALREVAQQPIASAVVSTPDGQEYSRLSEDRTRLLNEQRALSDEIAAARVYSQYEEGFSREASEQRARLTSIGIFDGSEPGHSCPLCSQELHEVTPIANIAQVKEALTDISTRLESVTGAAPRFEKAIGEIGIRLQSVQTKLIKNRAEMEAVRSASDIVQRVQDENAKQALILGRVSLYLESLPELPDTKELELKATRLRDQCAVLEDELSDERTKERIDSIVSILGQRMTGWARELELEHSTYPLRLDIKKLTIVADTADGPVPMVRMGSGENWIGYHLIGHLALHEWFVQRDRPVPRFLFLDQPSQVYFPPEKSKDDAAGPVDEDDRRAVSRMFKFVFDVVNAIAPGFQVVITEHADISEDWYQGAIVERWRSGLKLIPDDWPHSEN